MTTAVYLDPVEPDLVFVAPDRGDVVVVDASLDGVRGVGWRSSLPESAVELWTPQEVRDHLDEHLAGAKLSRTARTTVDRLLDAQFGPVSER